MKRHHLILVISVLVIAAFVTCDFSSPPVKQYGQWHNEYMKKKERRSNGFVKSKKHVEAKAREMVKYFNGMKGPINGEAREYPPNNLMVELEKAKSNKVYEKSAKAVEWVSRGPGNVGGRTRGLIVDPEDPLYNTWFAGSATGGVWKTTDGGENWTNLTPDIPYLSTSTIIMAPSNTNVIYVGTGESFGNRFNTGGGIFKSTDRGQSWVQLLATADDPNFRFVNRLIIDPNNEDIVLAATLTGIFKTVDGGQTWQSKFSGRNIEDLDADPSDFSIQYACRNSSGIYKSTDSGETWSVSSDGINKGERFELAISESDPQRVYVSAEFSDEESVVYVSYDGGANWQVFRDETDTYKDFLGGQGWYDNTIMVDPYDNNNVFVGGVDIWKLTLSDSISEGDPQVSRVDENNTQTFIEFVSFTGNDFTGVTVSGADENELVPSDWATVEIRFGPDKKQKAHRFEVPNQATSGVPASSYFYRDYVEVPFEVWDITNNRQLMVSFRDQEKDGQFNLYERSDDEVSGEYGLLGREYIYVNAIEYDENTPSTNVSIAGGHTYKNLYMLWVILPDGGTWGPENLPESNIKINYSSVTSRLGTARSVADAYGNYDGGDNYEQNNGMGTTSIPGFHPDHHNLIPIKIDNNQKRFWILNANDGGIGISKDQGETWEQKKNNYITTQFYGVAKRQGFHNYFGGTQDNGSWQSPPIFNATDKSQYIFQLGGDGFECIWHQENSSKIMGSIYNNDFYVTSNGGSTWQSADGGIGEDGPFYTRLSNSSQEPDRLYAVGTNGLWVSDDFGATDWETRTVGNKWTSGEVTSWHQVEISPANNAVIYCGAANSPNNSLAMYVSKNKGTFFSEVKPYTVRSMPYYFRSIYPHPNDEATVFVTYAVFGEPKILRSTDYGQTWVDLTGYGDTGERSTNGFPEVPCNCLLVFPEHPNQMWAGTDIGIFESKNSGETWEILETGMPAAPITQMFLQDGNVVMATYGRGIWTVEYDELVSSGLVTSISNLDVSVYPNPSRGKLNLDIIGDETGTFEVSVYDISGKVVYQESVEKFVNSTKKEIHLDGVKPGNYSLVVTGTKYRASKQVIITN